MGQETFTIQIGKCGIKSGHEFWKKISSEHCISPEGYYSSKYYSGLLDQKEIFYKESLNGKYIPRAFLFDLDPRILKNLDKGNYRHFYEKNNILFSTQSAGNNWAKGYYQSIEYQSQLEEHLRKNIENCDNLNNFNIFHSVAGGTGSGSTSLILEIIRDNFPGKLVNCYSIIPNQQGAYDAVVQPYNSILSFRWLTLYADCVLFFENASLEKIINSFNKKTSANLKQINNLISEIVSVSTENTRFPNYLNNNLETLIAPLIPTPNLHFLFAGISNWKEIFKKKNNFSSKIDSLKKIFENKTISFPFHQGKHISSLYFSNFDAKKNDFFSVIKKIHKENNIKYIEWGPISLQFSNNNAQIEKNFFCRNHVGLFNHTSIKNLFINTNKQYDILKKRNAFLNNYLKNFPFGDGMELFFDAKETIQNLIEEYNRAEFSRFF